MAALVYCTPSLRDIGSSLFYDSGLVLSYATYWRQRTVLARVLGGLRTAKSVYGWVGPCPPVVVDEEEPNFQGYVRVKARRVEFPAAGYKRPDDDEDDDQPGDGSAPPPGGRSMKRRPGESTRAFLTDLGDMNHWKPPSVPPISTVSVALQTVKLKKLPLAEGDIEVNRECQASLLFTIDGVETTFTCYTLPTFMTAHPCLGEHSVHEREGGVYSNIVEVNQLKNLTSTWKGM